MTPTSSTADTVRFRDVVTRRLGLLFEDAKLGFLAAILRRRLEGLGRSAESYLRSLEWEPWAEEIGILVQELTVAETYFFRHNEQFRALAEIVLPERMRIPRTPKILRLLSAGCASGEEAYSLAIVAGEAVTEPSWTVDIQGIDINPAMLRKAEQARYSAWALRETPEDIQRKWFHANGREMVLDRTAFGTVHFALGNLAADDPVLWRPESYDAIFCRNVLMYFAPEQMRAAVARMAQALAPGGFLFLGHAETLRGLSDDFHLRHTHETFYYKRKDRMVPAARSRPRVASEFVESTALSVVRDNSWFDAIRESSERVATLLAPRPTQLRGENSAQPDRNLTPALDLLRKERFVEALACIRKSPSGSDADPDVLLLEAALLVHGGQLEAAEDACLRLLLTDELNAGAHYLLALCREGAGDCEGAAEHDQVAAYLDPVFAMPRLHLGLLARRLGDQDTARRELRHAQILLESEQPSRLLLFGGGFSRQALIALCGSALADRGGRA
jgi:chemotaxis protein methyltransferase CheR